MGGQGKGGKGGQGRKGGKDSYSGGGGGGRGEGGGNPLEGKAYKDALADLCATTPVIMKDFDQRVRTYLDALQKAGKVDAAILHLKTSVSGIENRDKVQDWKKYTYKLLRDFDPDTYTAYKKKAEGSRQRGATAKKESANAPGQFTGFKTSAPAFTPGKWWEGGAQQQPQQQPWMPMYPMMMYPQMMMQPQQQAATTGGPPPPPPTKAAVPPGDAPVTEAEKPSTDAPTSEAR